MCARLAESVFSTFIPPSMLNAKRRERSNLARIALKAVRNLGTSVQLSSYLNLHPNTLMLLIMLLNLGQLWFSPVFSTTVTASWHDERMPIDWFFIVLSQTHTYTHTHTNNHSSTDNDTRDIRMSRDIECIATLHSFILQNLERNIWNVLNILCFDCSDDKLNDSVPVCS